MNKITQRYLAAHFVPPFMLSASFFVIFLLTFQLFRLIRIVINKGVEFSTVLDLTGYIAITFIPLAIPLSSLFSAIYVLNRMSEDSEIVAMRSFGYRKGQMFFPFLILGLCIGVAVFSLNASLIPHAKTQFKNTMIKLTSKGMLADIKEEQFFTEVQGVTLFAEKVLGEGNQFENIFIHHQNIGEKSERTIFAKKGALIKQGLGKLESPMIRMHLIDGNIIKTFSESSDVEKILFKEYDFPLISGGYRPGFITKDSMRTNKELAKVIESYKKKLRILNTKKNKGNELDRYEQASFNRIINRLPKSQIEFWTRINTPFQCLIFILLGFSLGIKKGRGHSRNSAAIGLFVLIIYYSVFFLGVSLARKGQIPPYMAVILPTFLGGIIGVRLYSQLDWVG